MLGVEYNGCIRFLTWAWTRSPPPLPQASALHVNLEARETQVSCVDSGELLLETLLRTVSPLVSDIHPHIKLLHPDHA